MWWDVTHYSNHARIMKFFSYFGRPYNRGGCNSLIFSTYQYIGTSRNFYNFSNPYIGKFFQRKSYIKNIQILNSYIGLLRISQGIVHKIYRKYYWFDGRHDERFIKIETLIKRSFISYINTENDRGAICVYSIHGGYKINKVVI